jgi:3D (Asp-Asp-Asp) domain-containing protein
MPRIRLLHMLLCTALVVMTLFALAVGGSAAHAASASKSIKMYVTSYGYDDNSPPSADIAYPKSDGYPTLHNKAYEGKGTYSDPITFATDASEFAPGTRLYVPFLEKYFIMEDDCAECDSDWQSHSYHIDLWMGPESSSSSSALYACEDKITKDSASVTTSPATTLTVDTTPLFSNNKCTAKLH